MKGVAQDKDLAQELMHNKSWAVIDRPYSLGCATVGALYQRPRCIFCAKPMSCKSVCSWPSALSFRAMALPRAQGRVQTQFFRIVKIATRPMQSHLHVASVGERLRLLKN